MLQWFCFRFIADKNMMYFIFMFDSGSANECQFSLSVQEFHMQQKLRGTLTYMTKVNNDISNLYLSLFSSFFFYFYFLYPTQTSEGTAQDKIDFKLPLPSSAFISPTPLPQ